MDLWIFGHTTGHEKSNRIKLSNNPSLDFLIANLIYNSKSIYLAYYIIIAIKLVTFY